MQGVLASGYADWPIIHQIAWLLGKLMDGIYNVMDGLFGIQNIGVCIIIFTIIYLYVDDPSYDQTAEMVEDVIRNESGDSERFQKKICRKNVIRHPC